MGKSGPFITSIHGAPGDCFQSQYILNGLLNSGYRILSWSRPGYLKTPIESGITYTEQADLLAALLETLKINKTSVAAFSCGGPCALKFAIRHPDLLSCLIMEASVSQNYSMKADTISKNLTDAFLCSNIGSWLSTLTAPYFIDSSIKILLKRFGNYSKKQYKKAFEMISQDYNSFLMLNEYLLKSVALFNLKKKGFKNDSVQCSELNIEIEKIKTPTLILHGICDGDVPICHSELMAQKISNSKFLKFEYGSHLLSLTYESEIIKAKLDFLMKHNMK